MIHKITSNLSRGMRHFMAGQGGFTLIELLVVVIILGVLAAVVTVNVSRFAGRGEQEAQRTEIQNVQLAVDAFMAENRLETVVGMTAGTSTPVIDFGDTDQFLVAGGEDLHSRWLRTQYASGTTEDAGGAVVPGDIGYCWDNTGEVEQVPIVDITTDTCP